MLFKLVLFVCLCLLRAMEEAAADDDAEIADDEDAVAEEVCLYVCVCRVQLFHRVCGVVRFFAACVCVCDRRRRRSRTRS